MKSILNGVKDAPPKKMIHDEYSASNKHDEKVDEITTHLSGISLKKKTKPKLCDIIDCRFMDYSKKKCDELIAICKEQQIKGYSGKRKHELIDLIQQKDTPSISNIDDSKDYKLNKSIAIPDCFVSPNLKLSNGKNGHGERRLYTGDSYEDNKKLTQKPWIIKYDTNYIQEITAILRDNEKFSKKISDREEIVCRAMDTVKDKLIYIESQNGDKDVRRYYVGPQKENKNNIKLWDTFRNTIIPKDYYLQLVEYDTYFECQIMCINKNPPNNTKKNNSVSNIQIEYFKYKEKEYGIEIQGAHNGIEFQLRNPENGYYWPIDGRHVCGIHRCSGSKDSPCLYNMHVWEFQGDWFHGNPEKYNKDDMFHNIPVNKKWEKDQKKKEFYESHGYKVIIVWESEWISEKKLLQSQGKTWRI